MNTLVYNQTEILERDEMLSLTDMWKAGGSLPNRDPKFWRRQDGVVAFIEALTASLNVTQDHLYETRRGKHGGGTWAHWQIAFAYAKYLLNAYASGAGRHVNDILLDCEQHRSYALHCIFEIGA